MNGPPQKPMTGTSSAAATWRDAAEQSRHRGRRVGEAGQRGDVGRGADRIGEHRTDLGHELHVDARGLERGHDVGEDHRRVDAEAVHRLLGDERGELGAVHHLEHLVLLAARRGIRAGSGRLGA